MRRRCLRKTLAQCEHCERDEGRGQCEVERVRGEGEAGTHIIGLGGVYKAEVDAVDVSLEVLGGPEALVAAVLGAGERLVRLGGVRADVGLEVAVAGEGGIAVGAGERALRGRGRNQRMSEEGGGERGWTHLASVAPLVLLEADGADVRAAAAGPGALVAPLARLELCAVGEEAVVVVVVGAELDGRAVVVRRGVARGGCGLVVVVGEGVLLGGTVVAVVVRGLETEGAGAGSGPGGGGRGGRREEGGRGGCDCRGHGGRAGPLYARSQQQGGATRRGAS